MRKSLLSWVLVLLQFFLLLYIVWICGWHPAQWLWYFLYAAGWLAAIAAALAFNNSPLSVFPEPPQKGQLVTHGIYHYIRHPFYTAVLCISGALVGNAWLANATIAWILLLMVLLIKISYEEKMLLQRFDDYSKYQHQTKKIIPFLY